MPARPVLRPIESTDVARVLEINTANVPEVGPLDHERLGFLLTESAIALCVEHDDDVVGFCLVLAGGSTYASVNYGWFMNRYPDALYLDRVALDASVRGRGWGTALYAEVERRMRNDFPAVTALTLEVNIDPPNDPSLRFHDKLGFSEVGRQMSHGIEVSLMLRPADLVIGPQWRSPSVPAPDCRAQRRSWRNRKCDRVLATRAGSMSANSTVSPPAPAASTSPSGSMTALSPL